MTAQINAAIRRRGGKPTATPAPARGDQETPGDPPDADEFFAGLAALREDDPRAWEALSPATRIAVGAYAAALAALEQEETRG